MKSFFSIAIVLLMALNLNGQNIDSIQYNFLKRDSIAIVPTGFGNSTKHNITGAVSHIESIDFNESVCKNSPLELAQNKLTGLIMSLPNSSDPTNRDMEFVFRGINSIFYNTSVTYFIDNVPGDINSIAPGDIETITLLRDVPSVNRFGSFASGPVILIGTKSANSNKLNINYSTWLSTELFAKYPDVYSASDIDKTNMNDLGYSTNWFDELLQNTVSHQHRLSLSKGFNHFKIYGSLNYRNFEGAVKKSDSKDVKGLLKLDFNALNNRLNINITGHISQINEHPTNYQIFEQAIKQNPTQPVYNQNGDYSYDLYRYQYYNPVNFLNESDFENKINQNSLKATVDFNIIKGWNLHADVLSSRAKTNYTETYNASYQTKTRLLGDGSIISIDTTTWHEIKNTTDYSYFDFYTNYNKTFGKHTLGLNAGMQYDKNENEVDYYAYYGLNRNPDYSSSQSHDTIAKNSYWGALNYNFNNKYVFNFSITHSSHSYFFSSPVTDPAASLAWVISNEGFLKNSSFINLLKLKGGYGIKTLTPTYQFNKDYMVGDLTNEKMSEYSVGIDWSILDNRISGSIDYYNRTTDNVIMTIALPSPPNFYDFSYANLAKINNRGNEIGLQAVPVLTKDFNWKVYVNYSTNNSKFNFVDNPYYYSNNFTINYGTIAEPITTSVYQLANGKPFGNFFGLKTVDVDKNGYLIVETPDGERIRFSTNLNTDENKQIIGNGIPKHYLGIANTFTYKKFDLAFNLHGAFGFQILNSQRMFYENRSINYNQLTSSSDLVYGKVMLSKYEQQGYLSYYIEDGDYLKIDNITLGYTSEFKKAISALRVYISAQNVYTFTKYKGIDPELGIGFNNPGYEKVSVYPRSVIFSLGFNVTFSN